MVLRLNYLTYIISQIYAYYFYKKVHVFLFILYINMEPILEQKKYTFRIIKAQNYWIVGM
jgi:hypothetical protein